MKKQIALFLIFVLLLPISGCKNETVYQKPVTFYYQATELSYDAACTVVESETREGASYGTTEEVLAALLAGPSNPGLKNPFPENTQVLSLVQERDTLYLTFSDELALLSGFQLVLACCCITLTCLDITDATQVCITVENGLLNGEKTITMNRDCLILIDSSQLIQGE